MKTRHFATNLKQSIWFPKIAVPIRVFLRISPENHSEFYQCVPMKISTGIRLWIFQEFFCIFLQSSFGNFSTIFIKIHPEVLLEFFKSFFRIPRKFHPELLHELIQNFSRDSYENFLRMFFNFCSASFVNSAKFHREFLQNLFFFSDSQ